MQRLIRKLNSIIYQPGTFVARWRSARMRAFVDLVRPPKGARILDLGGTIFNWNLIENKYQVTILNLPGCAIPADVPDNIEFVEGDACDLKAAYDDGQFDVVFSNSLIEHVGTEERQGRLRDEVLRLAPAYWIQTPSTRFPIEVHTGVPFYWQLPDWVVSHLHRSWARNFPEWYDMVSATHALSRKRMLDLFPKGEVYIERRFLLEKSYAIYKPFC